jgi:holliday junction resolvase YEN1
MAKRLIRLFGFHVHDAPGEAEAECALLQQRGIVHAVLSEDVDTIMFGCQRTLRNWSSEGTKSNKTPTHVSMYDAQLLRESNSGLDREGMVLVALMSGGDYLPEGIPGAGVKLACEAARAGFGEKLCRLKRTDTSELNSWREWLTYELRTNESGFFRTRHRALNVPDDFPNMDILRYYTHPVVSPASVIDQLRDQTWGKPLDIQGLREFARETFDWNYRIGAIKFIRVLAPCLLVRKLVDRGLQRDTSLDNLDIVQREEADIVNSLTGRRTHFSTDATPELRVSFIPTAIVGYDFEHEPDEVISYGRDGLALNSDDETEVLGQDDESTVNAKAGSRKVFDPTEPDLIWIPETVAKLGAPLTVEDWEEAQRAKINVRQKPKAVKSKTKSGGMTIGSLDRFVQSTKGPDITSAAATTPFQARNPLEALSRPNQSILPSIRPTQAPQKTGLIKPSKQSNSKRNGAPAGPKPGSNTNPWTIAGSQVSPRITKSSKPDKYTGTEAIFISSSPPASPSAASHSHVGSPTGKTRVVDVETTVTSRYLPLSLPNGQIEKPTSAQNTSLERVNSDVQQNLRNKANLDLTVNSGDKSRQKLSRTESLPIGSSSDPAPERTRKARGVLARAQTIASEGLPLDADANLGCSDDDLDLPPLSAVVNRLPRNKPSIISTNVANAPSSPISATTKHKSTTATPNRAVQGKGRQVQTTIETAFGSPRMTKLFVPRKSHPGYFKEVDVTADEAEVLKKHTASAPGRGMAWRRSDISCIDLTELD